MAADAAGAVHASTTPSTPARNVNPEIVVILLHSSISSAKPVVFLSVYCYARRQTTGRTNLLSGQSKIKAGEPK
jgi:hypothetical protein